MNIVPADILNSIPFFGIAIVFISLVYWIPAFFIVYHLTRFGIGSRPKFIALVFLVGSVILFSLFIIGASQFDLSVLAQQAGDYIKSSL
ncbi:MAG: hypothetical protein AAB374_01640 [Patescibacteria group bacterium]